MAEIMELNNGELHTIFGLDDFLELIDSEMGMEARRWLTSYLDELEDEYSDCTDLEAELQEQAEHHKEVMNEIHEHSKELVGLISEKELDRKAISNTVGSISVLTSREVNRC
jgi:hypothetical protein